MNRDVVSTLILLSLTVLPLIAALPDGAPDDACLTLTPQHGVPTSTDPNPYTVTVTKSTKGAAVTISGPWFEGFLVQTRDSAGAIIGEFTIDDSAMHQHLKCSNSATGSITHTQGFHDYSPEESDNDVDMDNSHHNDTDMTTHANEHPGSTHPPGENMETHHNEHHNSTTSNTTTAAGHHNSEEHIGSGEDSSEEHEKHSRSATFNWVNSGSSTSEVTFRVTVVQHTDTFWANFVGGTVDSSGAKQAAVMSAGLLMLTSIVAMLFT